MSVTSDRWMAAVLAVVVFACGWFEVHNLDLPLHARTGEWIVEHGRVPATNVLSQIHADYPSVHDKWLFQVAAYGLVDGLGTEAAIVARLALMALLAWAMVSTARGLGARPGAALLLVLLALMASRTRLMFRPDLVSLVLLALVVRTVMVGRPDGRGAWPLLLLQWLWVNVHGYFIQGPMVVLAVAAAHGLAGRPGRAAAQRWTVLGLGLSAVCLLNPSGVDGLLHPVRILADLREHYDFYSTAIVEFRGSFAPDFRGSYDRIAFFLVAGFALVLLLWQWRAETRDGGQRADAGPGADGGPGAAVAGGALSAFALPALALVLLLGVQALSLRRNMAPFAVAVAPLAAAALSRRLGPRVLGAGWSGLALPGVLAAAIVLGEMTDHTSVHEGLDRRWGWGVSQLAYPDAGIAFIAEHLPTAGVWTDFHYGSTFTGQRWPEQVASTNGNTHGYPTRWLMRVLDATNGRDPLAFDAITTEHGLDVALLPMASALSLGLMRRDDWALVALGREEAVYVRRSAVAAVLSDGRPWLADHELALRWRAGEWVDLVDTPPADHMLGLRRAVTPSTEIDQALLLMTAGFPDLARQRVGRAAALAPGHPRVAVLSELLAGR